ncbi:uncharacterized protein [Salminus brasiliensis]|uniref:uncharacterized protein n=1 Tax=Salminus brasiliensis TaxID=930266 RepID=UPI003B8363B5
MALSRFSQANRGLTRAKDYRADFSMNMQPYVNWDMHLTSAPLSIALLGELIRISAAEDFSIDKNAPTEGFKFIRYPKSFRACLLQVCNAGWQAFNEAHRNMDQIRLYTAQVPEYIKNAVAILIQEDTGLVKAFLPAELQRIEHISSECLKLAIATEGKFSDIMRLMEEFVEALVNARQGYSVELEEIKKKIQVEKIRQKFAADAKKMAEDAYENANKNLAEATEKYKKVMDDLPSGWNVLGMKMLSMMSEQAITITSGALNLLIAGPVTTTINTAVNTAKTITEMVRGPTGQATTSQESPEERSRVTEEISTNNILSRSGQILLLSIKMTEFYKDNKINWTELYDQKQEAVKSDYLKKWFERTKEDVNKESDCLVKTKALAICNKGIDICTELAQYAPKGECDDAKMKELIEAIKDLNTASLSFDSESKAYTGRPAFTVEPPHSSRQQQSMGKDVVEIQLNLTRLRMEQSEFLLKQMTERYEKNSENLKKKTKELDDIVIELQSLEPKDIDFNSKIKMLAKGLNSMGQVKEEWEKLVTLFQIISNIIKTTMTTHLQGFNQTVQIAGESNYTYSEFVKDKIYTYALKASASAYVVNLISTTYTEVSSQYLMGGVSTLGRLMTMDPNGKEFAEKMSKLQQDCIAAKKGITDLVAKNKQDFKLRCQNRITEIKTVLDEVLPQISQEEKMRLKEAVKNGIEPQSKKEEKAKPAGGFKPMTKEEEDQY